MSSGVSPRSRNFETWGKCDGATGNSWWIAIERVEVYGSTAFQQRCVVQSDLAALPTFDEEPMQARVRARVVMPTLCAPLPYSLLFSAIHLRTPVPNVLKRPPERDLPQNPVRMCT